MERVPWEEGKKEAEGECCGQAKERRCEDDEPERVIEKREGECGGNGQAGTAENS